MIKKKKSNVRFDRRSSRWGRNEDSIVTARQTDSKSNISTKELGKKNGVERRQKCKIRHGIGNVEMTKIVI